MIDLLTWWDNPLPPTALPVAVVCALCGAIVLAMYTRWLGFFTLVINAVTLFIGAYLGNLMAADLRMPLERYYVKPIVMSFVGMSFSALIVLMLLARNRNS